MTASVGSESNNESIIIICSILTGLLLSILVFIGYWLRHKEVPELEINFERFRTKFNIKKNSS